MDGDDEGSSPVRLDDDIENLGSQNTRKVLVPGRTTFEKTHVLIVKQRQQQAYGSDDFEIDVHRLYLSQGENALILKRTTEPSVLMDTQEETGMVISYILSFEQTHAEFIVNSDQYIYFDLTKENLVTIKDFRTPPSSHASPSRSITDHSVDPPDSTTAHHLDSFPRVGIASHARPSHFEELPLRQLRILLPGDRICTNLLDGDLTGGEVILEYQFEDLPQQDPPDGHQKHSTGLLTQPQDDDDDDNDEDQTDTEPSPCPTAPHCSEPDTQPTGRAGTAALLERSPPRRRPVEEVCASLLTQPQDDDTSVEEDPHATKDEQVMFHDDDDDSEKTVEMTQQVGMIIAPQTSQITTDPAPSVLMKKAEEGMDDEDSETTLGDADQITTNVEIYPLDTMNTMGGTTANGDDLLREQFQSTRQASMDSEEPKFDVENPQDNTGGTMLIDQASSVVEPGMEGTERMMESGDSPKEALEQPASNHADNIDPRITEHENTTKLASESLVDGSAGNLGPDDPAELGKDDHPVDTPSERPKNGAISQCKEVKEDLEYLPRTTPDPYLPESSGVTLVVSQPNETKEDKDALANETETKHVRSEKDPSLAFEVGSGVGSADSHERAHTIETSEKLEAQNVPAPGRNLLTTSSQDMNSSLLRDAGIETPNATIDDCQNLSANAANDTEEYHDSDNEKSGVDKLGGSPPCRNAAPTFTNVEETELEMKRPTVVVDTAKGLDHHADEITNTTETGHGPSLDPTAPVGDGRSRSSDATDDDVTHGEHGLHVMIDSERSPCTVAHTLTKPEAYALARVQMTPDKTRVKVNLENKKKLEEEMARRRQKPADDRQDLSVGKDNELPPKQRSSKRLAEQDLVSPPPSAVKRRRTGSRKPTPPSSRKSVSSSGSTPLSVRTTRRSFSAEEQERAKQICIMGTQAELDHEMIKNLGGTLYENIGDASKATHLIVDVKDDGKPKLIRTPKFMIAVARGCDIVHINFYKHSIINNEFLGEENFVLWNMTDAKVKSELQAFEKKYGFKLKESIERARQLRVENRLLLSGIKAYICPGVAGKNDTNNRTPIASEFRAILEGAGATVIKTLPESFEKIPRMIIITSKVQKEATKQKKASLVKRALEERDVVALTTTEIFDAITSQILPLRLRD